MYIIDTTPSKCSKCSAINQTETVTRGSFGSSEKVLRCTSCGHEKVISRTTLNHEPPVAFDSKQKEYNEF